ncbi:glutathione S-transferase family protein [Pseudoroseicyclus sp. CXY001]|uniref:glutathione S-transferase family protein n=1 Tax=Pseudoroseicyclus sp. CXY001 TaxID=3242492 RepID=UPI0035712CFF
MAILYGTWRSRALRVLWLAAEIGLPIEFRRVIQAYRLDDPLADGAPLNTLSPEFLAVSPAGAVPVLDDGGFILSESLAINLYLARKYGPPFGPETPQEDAEMQQWALYGATSLEEDALAIQLALTGGAPAEDVAEEAARLARPLAVLNAHLGRHGHLVGGRFTVADINMAEIVRYAQAHPTLLGAYGALSAWLAACQSRNAFCAIWAEREKEPVNFA